MPGTDLYAYAVGRVRAMEARLLDRGKLDRMVEAKNADEALKVLSESEYAEYLAELGSAHQFEKILSAELRRVYLELRKIVPDGRLIAVFALKFDYHNLKVLIKSRRLGENRDELLMPAVGNIKLTELARAVSEDNYSGLPRQMRAAAEEISQQFVTAPDPQLVDILLDRAMHEEILEMINLLKSQFLREYFTMVRDLVNIKTYLRIRRMNLPRDFFRLAYLPAGDINMNKLVQPAEPLEVLADRLAYGRYSQVVEDGVQAYQKTDTLTRYEKLADDFLLNFVKKAKYLTFGPEPIIGYLLAKENEIKTIRIIMVGKINHLPTEEIRERLRDVYV